MDTHWNLQGSQLLSDLRKMQSSVRSLFSKDTQTNKGHMKSYLVFLQSVLVDILRDMDVNFLKSPYPRVRSCISLAANLSHPVIASSPEYFLVNFHQTLSPTSYFVPLSFMELDNLEFDRTCTSCKSIDAEPGSVSKSCRFLTAHKFLPELSPLSAVNPAYRPLVGLLLGTDSIPNIKLPSYLYRIMNSMDIDEYKTRRWCTLISWFSKFSANPQMPVNEVLQCYPPNERPKLLKMLTESLAMYLPDLDLGKNLTIFLNPKAFVSTQNQVKSNRFVHNSHEPNSTKEIELWERRFNDLLKDQSTVILGNTDFTSGWPENLSQLYFRHKLAPLILTPVYCHGGIVMPLPVEDPNIEWSVYGITLPLRWMHYRLLCGLEHHLSQKQKLLGLNPNVLEHIRIGEVLTTLRIQVEPLIFNSKKDTTDAVISNLVGFSFSYFNPELKWTTSLALTLAFWFRATVENPITTPDVLSKSSIVLAVAAITAANYFNVEESDELSIEHYRILNVFLKNKSSARSHFNLSFVHHLTTIHIVYIYLRSLTNLVDQLLPSDRRSNTLSFLPTWISFPSGCLLHNLVVDLELLEPDDRLHLVTRYWLPRLYRIPRLNTEFAAKLQKLVRTFENIVHMASEMMRLPIPVPVINYTKETTVIPAVSSPTKKRLSGDTRSVKSKTYGSSRSRHSEYKPTSLFSDKINSCTTPSTSLLKKPLNEVSNRFNCDDALKNVRKKQSNKLPYHMRSTGYAARLRARLEETE
ncbi:unnamed protein product [Heterobilharzia americana]|nr:unnamed protein product [Heterobilharzia americana]